MFRVDWMPKGSTTQETSWHTTEQAAEAAEWRLKFGGATWVLLWFDAFDYARYNVGRAA
jgi:hypothetical protein